MDYLAIALLIVAFTVGGVILGIIIGTSRMRKAVEEGSVGHLRIDRSEPDEPPKAFWEIVGTTIEAVSHKDFIILKVINEDYISRD